MIENLMLALQITALGMGLVFLAIILLWLLLWALTTLPFKQADPNKAQTSSAPALADALIEDELRANVAAVAVAVALAEQDQSSARPLAQAPTALVSAWQLGMRTRQMYQKGNRH